MEEEDGVVVYEAVLKIPKEDVIAIREIFEAAFPIHYGDQFYLGLELGRYAGKQLHSFVAKRNGRVVGAACASIDLEGQAEAAVTAFGTSVYLMTLAVAETERRRGLATVLVTMFLDWAKRDPPACTAAYLHVIEYNTPAMEFYRKLGFAPVQREENFYPQLNGRDYAAMLYVTHFNGGRLPERNNNVAPPPASLLDLVFDWITSVFGKLFSGAPQLEEGERGDGLV